jgi:quercetin dioxygenase-like cupin family protein
VLRAGESFMMPRGAAHNGVNLGRRPAELLITYTLDKGAAQRTSVAPPAP